MAIDLVSEKHPVSLTWIPWAAFAVCLRSLSIGTGKRCPIGFAAFNWMCSWSTDVYTFIPLLLSAVTSSVNSSEPIPFGSHTSTCHNAASHVFDWWCHIVDLVMPNFFFCLKSRSFIKLYGSRPHLAIKLSYMNNVILLVKPVNKYWHH